MLADMFNVAVRYVLYSSYNVAMSKVRTASPLSAQAQHGRRSLYNRYGVFGGNTFVLNIVIIIIADMIF